MNLIKLLLLCVFLIPTQSYCMLKLLRGALVKSNVPIISRSFKSTRSLQGIKFEDIYVEGLFSDARNGDKDAMQELVDLQNNNFRLDLPVINGSSKTFCLKTSVADHLKKFNMRSIAEFNQKQVTVDVLTDKKNK